ncbi:MAG TPA: hypothetical protein VFW39_09705 [Sphingomicrobium sp.]|nr:hypothetical protein [Sphingomicrobium sp.]
MATTITAAGQLHSPKPFGRRHPSDYNFVITYVVLIWLAVLAGFVPDVIRHLRSHSAPYPIAVHVHAVVSIGWLALLTGQTLLVRNRNVRLHREIGVGGGVLAILVVLVGCWAAMDVASVELGTPKSRPQFLAIELSNVIEFAALAAAAISARKQPSAHKRLILLATLSLTPAAFNRAIGVPFLHPLLGNGAWQTFIGVFAATDLMVLGIGAYDWLTRRRIHPAWAFGATWIVVAQLAASWLDYNPAWKMIATSLVRAW